MEKKKRVDRETNNLSIHPVSNALFYKKGGRVALKGGFTFCETDINELGLEYAPEIEDTYVYRPANSSIHEQTFEGHNGGYFYGSNYEPKEFILRCIFEEKIIDKGFLSKIQHFFRIGKSGRLIFKRRPWCYYYATVTEYDDRGITNYLNGIIKITMKAYYPFARCDNVYSLRATPYCENIIANSALYDMEGMAPETSFTNITEGMSIILGNPGAERASVAVVASGCSGRGVTITNHTTKQAMRLVAMRGEENKEVHVDGISGKTILYDTVQQTSQLAFLYHAYGFIELEPAFPAKRNIYIDYKQGETTINVANIVYEDFVGKYIFAGGEWHKITNQPNKRTFIVQGELATNGEHRTMIMLMNEIEIRPDDANMNLSKLSFLFKPTFA